MLAGQYLLLCHSFFLRCKSGIKARTMLFSHDAQWLQALLVLCNCRKHACRKSRACTCARVQLFRDATWLRSMNGISTGGGHQRGAPAAQPGALQRHAPPRQLWRRWRVDRDGGICLQPAGAAFAGAGIRACGRVKVFYFRRSTTHLQSLCGAGRGAGAVCAMTGARSAH